MREQQDRAAGVVAAEKSPLRAAQNLHRVDIEECGHGALTARHVHAVDVQAHRGIEHDRVAIDRLSAHRDIERRDRLGRGVHMHIGHVAPDILEQHRGRLAQLLPRAHADRERRLRDGLGTAARVDDDLVQLAVVGRGTAFLRGLVGGQRGRCAQHHAQRKPRGRASSMPHPAGGLSFSQIHVRATLRLSAWTDTSLSSTGWPR